MTGVVRVPRSLEDIFRGLTFRIRALETQQQQIVSNGGALQPVVNLGRIGPDQYGLQFVDPTTGEERLRVGTLPDGEYGIELTDPLGTSQNVIPKTSSFAVGTFTAVGSTPIIPAGAPVTTAYIGPSGDCFVTVSIELFVFNTGNFANVFLVVDGTVASAIFTIVQSNLADASNRGSWQITKIPGLFSLLTPNQEHTFSIALSSTNAGQTIQAVNVSVVVQPI